MSRLPAFVCDDAEQATAIDLALSPALETATPAQLARLIDALAGQMRNRRERPDDFRLLDLRDFIARRGYILLFGGQQEIYVEKYRELVEARVLDVAANHPAVQAIERGDPVNDEQLLALKRSLRRELGGPGVEQHPQSLRVEGGQFDGVCARVAGSSGHPRLRRTGVSPLRQLYCPPSGLTVPGALQRTVYPRR